MKFSGFSVILLALSLPLVVVGCTAPPPTAYVQASISANPELALGKNDAGESCALQRIGGRANIYCGDWSQPSAHVQDGGVVSAGGLSGLAARGALRARLESAYSCQAPHLKDILNGVPAEIFACTQRLGGWPYVFLITQINGQVYYADGVQPALPVMQRAIGVMSGEIKADSAAHVSVMQSDDLLAQSMAAHAFSSGDVGQYNDLMALGEQANQAEDFPAATLAYRAALSLQQEKLGLNSPDTLGAVMALALSLSDQGLYSEAESQFIVATKILNQSKNPILQPQLFYDEALNALNQGKNQQAVSLLIQARTAYIGLMPASLLTNGTGEKPYNRLLFSVNPLPDIDSSGLTSQMALESPIIQEALLGVVESLRYQALALENEGNYKDSEAILATAAHIVKVDGLQPALLVARLDRTSAVVAAAEGDPSRAANDLKNAVSFFDTALPGTLPVAETDLLRGRALARSGDKQGALMACREGVDLMRTIRTGSTSTLIGPCLGVYAEVAAANPAQANTLYAEMFEAAELTQGSLTTHEIGQAAARLASSATDPKVAVAIRAQQDALQNLEVLYQKRDEAERATGGEAALGKLDQDIAKANTTLQQASLAEQEAAPNYAQLIQQVVPVSDVLKLLKPDEAYLGITTTPENTWLFFLHNGKISVAETAVNETAMAGLVKSVRASMEPGPKGLPPFDMKDAQKIYADTLGPFSAQMSNVDSLVITPSGALLAMPFALLPTGPASADNLVQAPWLIRKVTLAYVPAAENFVSLRLAQGTSQAKQPWFGFGGFKNVTLQQAQATYNPRACPNDAEEFANLPALPYSKLELKAAAAIFGAGPQDELLDANFTVPNIEKMDLKNFQILHFATHALLPTDMICQTQPAIVTSAPPGAKSAQGALLTASDVMGLKLNAKLVILSACNTGGGQAGGEALSGLARSFFYAGARAVLVTQWSVNDQVSSYLVANMLMHLHTTSSSGVAQSLRFAQLALIDGAGKTMPAQIADPFYWAAFAVIGDGGEDVVSYNSQQSLH